MPRFKLNRRLAFILALSITLGSANALWPSIGRSDEPPVTQDQPIGGDNAGDPDRPFGSKGLRGRPFSGGMGIGRSTAGDGAVMYNARMVRLRAALMCLKGFYFRF
jgi:hypothetical protein